MKKILFIFTLITLTAISLADYNYEIVPSYSEPSSKAIIMTNELQLVPKNQAKFIGNYLYDENFNKVYETIQNYSIELNLKKNKVYYNVYEFEKTLNSSSFVRIQLSYKPFINQCRVVLNEISKKNYRNGYVYSFNNDKFEYNIPLNNNKVFVVFKFETK